MTVEDLEFWISQYVDGTLSASDWQIVDEALHADPGARKVLADYQKLNGQLATLRNQPAVQWDQFAQQISASIEAEDAPAIAGRIGFSSSRWRIAAGLLVAATAALIGRHAMQSHQVIHPITPASSVIVSGPQPEVASGAPVQEITVGPSPALARENADWRYGEGVVGRGPSKITILGALNPPANHDSNRH